MVTGDHIETAKQVALQSGIVKDNEVNQPGICMTGQEFIEAIGPYTREFDEVMNQYNVVFENEE